MIADRFILDKFKFFETVFFNKLQDKTNKPLLEHKLVIKKLVNSSIQQTLNQDSSNFTINQEIVDSIKVENEREKSHFSSELHNGLEQILTSLSFYVEVLQHAKKLPAKLKNQYLDKIKELSQTAMKTSNEVANNLISNQLQDGSLLNALSSIYENSSAKHQLKINQKFSANFNEIQLNSSKKLQLLKIVKTLLHYFISIDYQGTIDLNYTFKYNNILQIEIRQKAINFNLEAIEKSPAMGYNNIKHCLGLLNAKMLQKDLQCLIIKTPINDKI